MASQNGKDPSREKALDLAVTQIERNFGKGAIMRLGAKDVLNVAAISTGSIGMDLALGVGGIPRGRIVEIFGPESGGKTTIALHMIAQAQNEGGMAAFIDAEHALDPEYAKRLGVDVDNLLVSQPDYGEQALDIAEMLIRSGAVDVLVVDSVAALVPKAELDGEMGETQVGLQARLMSHALRKLAGVISKSKAVLIFINQIRQKIGVMYGSNETTTGGNALKFYSSIRLEIRRISTLKEGENSIGNRVRAKVVKNKVAPPFKQVQFDIMFGTGISKEGELLDYAVDLGLVDKSGSWFSYGKTRLGQGRENVKTFLAENDDIRTELDRKVREALGLLPADTEADNKAD